MNTYIVRFAGTPPNHYDAPAPRLLESEDKDAARAKADALASREGLRVNSVRKYFGTHEVAGGAK
jgi:hypothetical protein